MCFAKHFNSAIQNKVSKKMQQIQQSSATLFRVDCEGVRWTYHKQFQTIAIYTGHHRDKHSIRLPGDRSREVLQSEIADPFCQQAGGPQRWPLLQK